MTIPDGVDYKQQNFVSPSFGGWKSETIRVPLGLGRADFQIAHFLRDDKDVSG